MEFKTTLEIVTKDIQDIEKLVSNFKNYSRIPNIELDLALSRLRNVYDLLLMFRDDSHADTQKPAHKTSKDTPAPAAIISAEPEPVIPASPAPVVIASPAANPTVIENAVVVAPDHAPIATEKPGVKKKAEEEKIFIHEKLGKQANKKDISSKLQSQAIKSIAGSLGINDKFFFIRELFAGNAETFRQTMNELDDARNFNEAYSILMNKFQWDMDSEPVQMLLNLIHRKFITTGNE